MKIKNVAHLPGAAAINPGGRTTGKHTPLTQSPAERAAEVAKASEAGKGIEGLGHKVDKFVAASEKRNVATAAAKKRAEKAYIPSDKDLQRVTGGKYMFNVGLDTPKIRHKHIDTNVVQAGFGPTGDKVPAPPRVKGPEDTPEVRPDVGELSAGNKPSRTSYREPPKKPTPDRRGVPLVGMGKPGNYRWTAAGVAKSPQDRTIADLVVPGVRSGTSGVGSKPTRPPSFSSDNNRPPTKSSSAILADRGAVGKAGSEKRDIKNRNIDKPEKPMPEGFSQEVYDFLEALLHVDWETHKKTGGIFKFDPNKSKFQRTKFAPVEPVQDRELPPGTAPEEKKQLSNDLSRAAANLGILGGKRVTPSTRPRTAADASKQLFGEDTMNPDKIANDIIREAFTSGDRNNVTTSKNDMHGAGSIPRQMLSGEFFGSAAWPFDEPQSPDFAKSNELQADQAEHGQGEGCGTGYHMESVAVEIVDNLLEDSPSSIYSDPQSVGYLINELQESGYTEYASTVTSICEDAKEEDVVKVVEMIEKMEAEKADPFLIEQLAKFANLLIEDDMKAANDDNPEDPNASKEDAASKVDTGEDTGGSGL